MRDNTVRRLSAVHRVLYRISGGLIGGRLVNNDMLLLTTTGQRSGRSHTVPLLYVEDDDSYVVIASYGGRPDHPQWYKNLTTSGIGRVQLGSNRIDVRARVAAGDERARLWESIIDAYNGYSVYQSRTDRVIPVVVLSEDS